MSAERVGSFDLAGAWMLSDQVALRPEPFGALAYDFRTRRLSFLKDPQLVEVVRALGEAPSARAACDTVAVPDGRRAAFAHALGTLAASGMIEPRKDR